MEKEDLMEENEIKIMAPCQFEGTDACEYCDIVPCLNDVASDDSEEHY